MPTTLNPQESAEVELAKPKKSISMSGPEGKQSPANRIFDSIRAQIAEVFPDDDEVAWTRVTENFEEVQIARPATEYDEWFEERFEGSDEFSQLFTRRMFMVWDELEQGGFIANERELWEHQKALFAWAALNICTGSREDVASLLLRSPYGSGKSLVTGLIARAFRDAQLDLMLLQGVDPTEIPTGALVGMRKEHMIQNAVGEQFSVLQPPYNVERGDIIQYWKDFEARHGEKFTNIFPRPKKATDLFFAIFRTSEDEEDEQTVRQKIDAYLQNAGKNRTGANATLLKELEQLANGEIVFRPDDENIPQPKPAQLRAEHLSEEDARFRGDSAHAILDGQHYHVKGSHKDLAPDPTTYSTKPDPEAQFAIVHGTALTRNRLRGDMDEFAKRCRALFLDEAYKLNPGIVGDAVAQRSGQWPTIIGVTAQDMGIEGWDASPSISRAKMIELGLTKPIAYTTIGSPENPPSAGSQEAMDIYITSLFEEYDTAEALRIEQPYEKDTVTIVKAARVHEYATQIRLEHVRQGVPVEVFVYHADAGKRKTNVLNAFKAPKKEGDPRRILVATEEIAFGHSMPNAECYDFPDDISLIAKDQAIGRLGHVRSVAETDEEKEVERCYVREQHLHKGKELAVRQESKKNGYEIPDEDATWVELHNMIDASSYELDEEWDGLGDPVPIADTPKSRTRKLRKQGPILPFVGEKLGFSNPHSILKEEKRLDRMRRQREAREEREHMDLSALEASITAPPVVQRSNNGQPPSSGSQQKGLTSSVVVPTSPSLPPEVTKQVTAGRGDNKLTIEVRLDGTLTQACYASLKAMAPGGYQGSLGARIMQQQGSGLRNKQLAAAIIVQMKQLNVNVDGHSRLGSGESESRYIGVKSGKH